MLINASKSKNMEGRHREGHVTKQRQKQSKQGHVGDDGIYS